MLRADQIICGTTTTGTGTLTLAATPAPPGGVDFDVFCRATGIGLSSSTSAVTVSYTIVEYTSSSFATAKAHEKGVGTLSTTGSVGIANCTLARTTKQSSATSLNAPPATQNIAPATGISIGTAANTLVFIGPSAADVMGFVPYVDSTATNAGGWISPLSIVGIAAPDAATGVGTSVGTGNDYYLPFFWAVPKLIKNIKLEVKDADVGTTNLYARIYQINSAGQPGKLLYDFGVIGTAGSSFALGNTVIQGAGAGSGFFMAPGGYFLNLLAIFTVGPTLYGLQNTYVLPPCLGIDYALNFSHGLVPFNYAKATGGNATAPDPANVAGYTVTLTSGTRAVGFALS